MCYWWHHCMASSQRQSSLASKKIVAKYCFCLPSRLIFTCNQCEYKSFLSERKVTQPTCLWLIFGSSIFSSMYKWKKSIPGELLHCIVRIKRYLCDVALQIGNLPIKVWIIALFTVIRTLQTSPKFEGKFETFPTLLKSLVIFFPFKFYWGYKSAKLVPW